MTSAVTLTMSQRRRLTLVKEVPASEEPIRLFVRRNESFLRSFKTREEMEQYLETIPDYRLQPPSITRRHHV